MPVSEAVRVLDPLHDRGNVRIPIVIGLQIDQDPAAIERGVGAVHADERGEALNVGILQDDARRAAAGARPSRRRRPIAAPPRCLDHARVLYRKEALGDHDIEHGRQREGAERDNSAKVW